MTRVVHCKRSTFDVYIGRPSKWGNPFKLEKESDRQAVLQRYEAWLRQQPDLIASLGELRGKVLACWCAPRACHGDVLVKLADEFFVDCPSCSTPIGPHAPVPALPAALWARCASCMRHFVLWRKSNGEKRLSEMELHAAPRGAS